MLRTFIRKPFSRPTRIWAASVLSVPSTRGSTGSSPTSVWIICGNGMFVRRMGRLGGLIGRRVQPVGTVPGRALRGQPGTRSDAAGTGAEDWRGVGDLDASRADGGSAETRIQAESAGGGGGVEKNGEGSGRYMCLCGAKK